MSRLPKGDHSPSRGRERATHVSTQLPSRRLPVECDFSPDELFEARFRVENTSNLREGEQLPTHVGQPPSCPPPALML